MVQHFGWNCQLMLDKEVSMELVWLHSNLVRFNGQGIRNRKDKRKHIVLQQNGLQRKKGDMEELMQAPPPPMVDTQGEQNYMLKLNQETEVIEELPEKTVQQWQQAK